MNIEQLANRLDELGANHESYRVGKYGSGTSDAILLRETEDGYGVFYTERGHDTLLASFKTEEDACEYTLKILEKEESGFAHCVGIFDTAVQASGLAEKLAQAGIKPKTDEIPMTATSKRYRVFVFGPDIHCVKEIRGW